MPRYNYRDFNGVDLRFSPDANKSGPSAFRTFHGRRLCRQCDLARPQQHEFKERPVDDSQKTSIKFGGSTSSIGSHQDHHHPGNGEYSFTSLQNFLQARPMSLEINLPNGATVLGMKVTRIRSSICAKTASLFTSRITTRSTIR